MISERWRKATPVGDGENVLSTDVICTPSEPGSDIYRVTGEALERLLIEAGYTPDPDGREEQRDG